MKSAITTTALSSLLFSFVALTSLQASSASLPSASQQPTLMLAEGGGDRLIQYREWQAQREQTTDDESERFAQLVEEKPTAAGAQVAREERESNARPATGYQSRVHHLK
ncbi:hypothetical protein E8F11_25530 [Pseudomonas sp. BN417]|uniref:hypothetical protein n=1 Tax=Pseudomonas sp. BN417 TaxID=2567890 RepID=UPI002457BE8E|nr:hypothetical protein [Pseudomonas sp. BN417]MDH4558494.1 hypothetical protein [Pseudomonas sp. BN417]